VLLALALLATLAIRAWGVRQGPPLEPWHTWVPDELRAEVLDDADWPAYLEAERAVFAAVEANVTDRLEPGASAGQRAAGADRVLYNRYVEASPVYPANLPDNWNRSQLLEPDGVPAGAVVFLHGLTDSPYSGRSIVRRYRDRGWLAIAIRLPAHGTVPAALTAVEWEDWQAATRLAVREARRRAGPSRPLHLIGYSNGGALALQYALDALDDPQLERPERVVLISPMIGVTRFARFAGIAAWPAVFPAFAPAAWLSVRPELNPFKYESFPVNGAVQSHRLTDVLQRQIVRLADAGRFGELAPVLTFQSVLDFTVSTRALVDALYAHLPENGSELVLFDINRTSKFAPLLRSDAVTAVARLLPAPPRRFRTSVVTNVSPDRSEVAERVSEAGAVAERTRPLGLRYPADVFSLSHVALPFPPTDGLYGFAPDPDDRSGINLGTLAARGELGALVVNPNASLRMLSNPFFAYLLERIQEGIAGPTGAAASDSSA
jgi:alpha-beta hydrolase superfamily lysophospholipase